MQLELGIELQNAVRAAASISWDRSTKRHGTAGSLRARSDIQRMQPIYVRSTLFCLADNIESICRRIDNRRARDTNFRYEICVVKVDTRDARSARCRAVSCVKQSNVPQGLAIGAEVAVRVKRIDAVVFGGYEYDVVLGAGLRRARAHRDVGHV